MAIRIQNEANVAKPRYEFRIVHIFKGGTFINLVLYIKCSDEYTYAISYSFIAAFSFDQIVMLGITSSACASNEWE